jgi:hypothetical protein
LDAPTSHIQSSNAIGAPTHPDTRTVPQILMECNAAAGLKRRPSRDYRVY